MGENVTAIVPAYNEQDRILLTLAALKKIKDISEIIVVDDSSKDSTYEILKKENGIILLHNNSNKGKGSAVRLGLSHASNAYTALVDADIGDSASEIEKLVRAAKSDNNSIVIGMLPPSKIKGGFGFLKLISTKGFYALTSVELKSVLSGQRVLPTAFLRELDDIPDGYSLEFKVALEGIRHGLKLVEVPVDIHHRETGRNISGFLHRGKQCTDILKTIIMEMTKY
ncbi:MAG: glycosyltransferase family 2 protein [Caulobacteraceae bacterium]